LVSSKAVTDISLSSQSISYPWARWHISSCHWTGWV